jgi:HAD superfamily hydrolase (TIGR01509 family)
MPNIQAIIFDCDGTLVDSEPITNDVIIQMAAELDVSLTQSDCHDLFAGRNIKCIGEHLAAQSGREMPPDFVSDFRSRQAIALERDLRPIEGAVELLEQIERPMFLASNAPREKIEINLRVSGLRRFFPEDLVFSAYDREIWKPDPDLFFQPAARAGVDPEYCAVVEDSLAGLEAAGRAGMQVFYFAPHGPLELPDKIKQLPAIASIQVVTHLSQLTKWFC